MAQSDRTKLVCGCGQRCDRRDRFCRACGTRRAPRSRWRLGRAAAAAALVAGLTLAAAEDDVVPGVSRRIEVEAARQAAMGLEDAHANEARPKAIRITCPEAPQVVVEDLGDEAVQRNECLVFHVAAPDLDARLVIKCDGELDADRSFYGDFV